MSLYGHTMIKESAANNDELAGIDLKPYVELMAYDDISHASDTDIKAFIQSEAATVLQEKQVLNKGTMMRLSKADDEKRRIILVCYQLAKEDGNADYKKMIEYRNKWKMHRKKVLEKYSAKAKKVAVAAQREYIKTARKEPVKPAKEDKVDK